MISQKVNKSKAPSITVKAVKKLAPIGTCNLLPNGTKVIFDDAPRSTKHMLLLESHSSVLPPASPTLVIDGVHAMPRVPKSAIPDIQSNIEGLCESGVLVPQYRRDGFHRIYRRCLQYKSSPESFLRLDIYLDPLRLGHSPFLFSFNPAVMANEEWGTFHDLTFQIFNGKAHIYFKKGYYRSIDVAIDFPHIHIGDLSIAANRYTDSQTYSKSGALNAIVFGSRKSRTRVKIYNKALHLKRRNPPLGYELTRFEATYKGHMTPNEPSEVENLFNRLTVSHNPVPENSRAPDLNFFDAVKIHGAEKVVRRYGCPKSRAQKHQLLKEWSSTEFDFENIWKKQWPKAYKRLYRKLTKRT